MDANPLAGAALLAVGGLMGSTFYVPFRGIRKWSWETYWLAGGVFSWIIAPCVLAMSTTPNLLAVLRESPLSSLLWCYVFGAMWGIGGLSFGLTMRYLGLSLGNAVAVGLCAAFGTLMPPIFSGEIHAVLATSPGHFILLGIAVCLGGITVCGLAGISKERELSSEAKTQSVKEFDFVKGVMVAVFAGVMSASMSYGIAAGKPIAALAVAHGAKHVWQNMATFVVILAGGFTTNFLWCLMLHAKNGSAKEYRDGSMPLLPNYLFAALAGTTWYLQFMFYGMGASLMGRYDFSSWTLHMGSTMVFGTFWGLALNEWKGSSRRTYALMSIGLIVLVASTVVVGYGNYLATGGSD